MAQTEALGALPTIAAAQPDNETPMATSRHAR